MRTAFANRILDKAVEKNLILVTGDLGFGVFERFEAEHPARFLNAGITEQAMTSMAAGLADGGYRPIIYSIANFPTLRNYEQIRNDICYPNRPVLVVAVGAGLSYGSLGSSHFGVEDIGVMRLLPNLRILAPSDPIRTKEALDTAFESESPAYIRLSKSGEANFGPENKRNSSTRLISGNLEHSELTVLSVGAVGADVNLALKGGRDGVTHFSIEEIWPIDLKLLDVIERSNQILVVEEHIQQGGFFSIVCELLMARGLSRKVHWRGVDRSKLTSSGSHSYLLSQTGLGAPELSQYISSLLET